MCGKSRSPAILLWPFMYGRVFCPPNIQKRGSLHGRIPKREEECACLGMRVKTIPRTSQTPYVGVWRGVSQPTLLQEYRL